MSLRDVRLGARSSDLRRLWVVSLVKGSMGSMYVKRMHF